MMNSSEKPIATNVSLIPSTFNPLKKSDAEANLLKTMDERPYNPYEYAPKSGLQDYSSHLNYQNNSLDKSLTGTHPSVSIRPNPSHVSFKYPSASQSHNSG